MSHPRASIEVSDDTTTTRHPQDETVTAPVRRGRHITLGMDRFSGLYVWALIIVIFSLWVPHLFLHWQIAWNIAGDQAITCMLAFGLIFPIAAGVFDLSIAAIMGFAVCSMGYLVATEHWNPVYACLVTVVFGLAIGTVNGIMIVVLNVSSFIATLAMSSVLAGLSYWIVDGTQIVLPANSDYLSFGGYRLWQIPLPFYLMLVLGIVVFVVIEYTPTGRRLFAVGGNPQAARLAGVRVDRVVFGSLLASAFVASLTGILLAAKVGVVDYSVGPNYLLPSFSAVFLGSTQIKAGKVNVIGTIVGVYLLATGVKGLQLAGAATWVNDLFNGLALGLAVALSARTLRKRRSV